MKIENISVEKLIEYKNNNKYHPPEQVEKIAKSINEFGFNIPILIDKDNIIIAGHGRLLAAKQLELLEVPCVRLSELSDQQIKAFRIMDNKSAISDFNFEALKIEFDQLDVKDFNLELTGFTLDEIQSIKGVEKLPNMLTEDGERVKKPFMSITFNSIDDMQEVLDAIKEVVQRVNGTVSVSQ